MKTTMSTSRTRNQTTLRKRNLKELDDVIEKIIDRNPGFVVQLEKMIENKLKEQDALPRRSRSR